MESNTAHTALRNTSLIYTCFRGQTKSSPKLISWSLLHQSKYQPHFISLLLVWFPPFLWFSFNFPAFKKEKHFAWALYFYTILPFSYITATHLHLKPGTDTSVYVTLWFLSKVSEAVGTRGIIRISKLGNCKPSIASSLHGAMALLLWWPKCWVCGFV